MTTRGARAGVEVSVVIPCYNAAATLGHCLRALSKQRLPPVEVIVVDGSPDPIPSADICKGFDFVRHIRADPELGAHAKRNLGAAEAIGNTIVFTDPDCVADPGWLSALVDAHREGHEVVGGTVGALDGVRNQSIHMCKYAWWLPGAPEGEHLEIPSANTSLTRAAWERIGPYRDDRWAGDSELSWRIRQAGEQVWLSPNAQVTHLDHGPWGAFLKSRLERGYDFGMTRAEHLGWSRLQRILRALLVPLVPFVMTLRAAGHARRAQHAATWMWTLPFQIVAHACWAKGEAVALIVGRSE